MENEPAPSTPQDQAVKLATSPRTIKDMIRSKDFESAVAAGLPRHLTKERFVRFALNATLRQPELMNCTKESFFLRMLELAALGIEPDGRRAHLIPFADKQRCHFCQHKKDRHKGSICTVPGCKSQNCGGVPPMLECTLIIDYKGISELVRRSGDVSYMHADAVYSLDEFDFKYGSGAFLTHRPNLKEPTRGTLLAFYSFVKLRDGNEDFIVMSVQDVNKVRSASKNADGNNSPWTKWYDEMGKKTVFRRHSKWLPLSPEVRDVVEADDDSTIDLDGAFTVAAENYSVSDDDDHDPDPKNPEPTKEQPKDSATRIEDQMREQAQQHQQKADTTTQKSDPNPHEQQTGKSGRWLDRDDMLSDFAKFRESLGDIAYYRICAGEGISSEDDLGMIDAATEKAYLALKAAREQPAEDTPNLRPRSRR